MIKQFNNVISDSIENLTGSGRIIKDYEKTSDLMQFVLRVKQKFIVEKELFFMLSMSAIWMCVFIYFLLHVFTG